MNRQSNLVIAPLCAVFAVIMTACAVRIHWLRVEAREDIPWHFNGVPLVKWSEERWTNCYAQLGVYAVMVATIVVFWTLMKQVYKTSTRAVQLNRELVAAITRIAQLQAAAPSAAPLLLLLPPLLPLPVPLPL